MKMMKSLVRLVFGSFYKEEDINMLETLVMREMVDYLNQSYEFENNIGITEKVSLYAISVELSRGKPIFRMRCLYNHHKYSFYLTKYTNVSEGVMFFIDQDGVSPHEVKKRNTTHREDIITLYVSKGDDSSLINTSLNLIKKLRK